MSGSLGPAGAMTNRREFLASLARAGIASAALAALPPWVRSALAADLPEGFIVRNDRPECWETTLEALGRAWITPNDRFFVRSHLSTPRIEVADWRLEVTGLVRTPLSLSIADLDALPQAQSVHVLECAGNGRALLDPPVEGEKWELGAVSTAEWTGVPLVEVLDRAERAGKAEFEVGGRRQVPVVAQPRGQLAGGHRHGIAVGREVEVVGAPVPLLPPLVEVLVADLARVGPLDPVLLRNAHLLSSG